MSETAKLDEKNPILFHAQSLRMAAEAFERSVNDPRPQNPEFARAVLESAVYHIGHAMQLRELCYAMKASAAQ